MIYILALLLCLSGEKSIVVDLKAKEWRAYSCGELINKGEANGGRRRCVEDKTKSCRTPQGKFRVLKKYGHNKRSDLYPTDCVNKKKCGAKMYYFIKFHWSGAGIHGTDRLTGYNVSHGCVRVSIKDAKWINEFVEEGTEVIVNKY